jgi:hypothetical protein
MKKRAFILGASFLGFDPVPRDQVIAKIIEQLTTSTSAWITYSTPKCPDRITTGIRHSELSSCYLRILLSALITRPTEVLLRAKFAFLPSDV